MDDDVDLYYDKRLKPFLLDLIALRERRATEPLRQRISVLDRERAQAQAKLARVQAELAESLTERAKMVDQLQGQIAVLRRDLQEVRLKAGEEVAEVTRAMLERSAA
jgi:predicted  nucleic acid-binding Zn-ribbon protein